MDDLISRQAAIDALDKTCDRECKYTKEQMWTMCGTCPLVNAFDAIEELPSAQAEVIPHRNYKYLSDYWCECGWHLGKK